MMKQLLDQKDAELRHAQKDVEKLLHESKTYQQDLEEEKERNRLQVISLIYLVSREGHCK